MRQPVARWLVVALCGLVACTCARGRPDDGDLDERLAAARDLQREKGPRAAIPVLERLLRDAQDRASRPHEALALGQLGTAHKNLGDYARALELHGRALTLKRSLGDEVEVAKTLSNIGLVEEARGNCRRALDLYSESLEIFTRLDHPRFAASVLNNRGLCHDALGDYRRSLADYEHALQLHLQSGNEIGESETRGNIGGVQMLLGRFADAIPHYEAALAISRRLDVQQSMALDHINLGLARLGAGDLAAAREHMERGREIATRAGLGREEADATRALSVWLEQTGRYDEAVKTLDEAAAAYERAGLARERVDADRDAGDLALDTGDLSRAAKAFDRAASAAAALGYASGHLSARLAIARLDLRRQHLRAAGAGAHDVRESARAIADLSTAAIASTLLARVRLTEGRAADAIAAANGALEEARSTRSSVLEAEALLALADAVSAAGSPEAALSHYEEAVRIAPADLLPALAWRIRFGFARALEALGRLEDALVEYRRAVDVIEAVRSQLASGRTRTGYLDDKRQVYAALVRILLRLGRTEQAFDAAERLRANGYVELVSQSVTLGAGGDTRLPASLVARIRQLQESLEAELGRATADRRGEAVALYRDELREAETAWSRALDALSRTEPLAIALRTRSLPGAAELRRRLPDGSALLQFVVDRDATVVFVLTQQALRARALPVAARTLRTRTELLRALMDRVQSDDWAAPAESLDADLIAPLRAAGWLDGVRHLFVVPHAELNYVPFALLRRQTPAGVRLLVEDVSISLLPAATALTFQPDRRPPPSQLLAMAPARPRLPFARREVEAIGRLYAADATLAVGADASEERFKREAGQYRILHLATHGFFHGLNPLFSGIDLERSGADDGRLQVYEILGLSLAADLVTLSACDTALGAGELVDLPAGEELVGLTRAFLSAGSRHVLATLWQVSDRATAALMSDFYEAVRSRPPAEALADVQRRWLARAGADRHPFYWAPFVLSGAGSGKSVVRSVKSLQEHHPHVAHH